MKKLIMALFVGFCVSAAPVAAQEKVVVGGSGAMGEALDALVKNYKQKNPSDTLEHIPDSMSTTGGIEGTKGGRLTVGVITRPLNDGEKKEGLAYRPASRIPVVVGVHKSNSISALTDAQVCDIFSGKAKNWKDVGGSDGKITVVGRKSDDNFIELFREKMGCFKSVQLPADAVLLVRGTEVLDSLNNRPGTVAISVAGALFVSRPNIKSLSLNGVAPTLEAVQSGKYKYFNEVGFITKGEPKGTAKKFVDFVASGEGEKVLEKYGMTVVR